METRSERILIVDDDKAFRVATVAFLKDAGYHVQVAKHAEEGIQRINEEHFDLILSDMVMQGMNGIGFLQYIKSKFPNVIVMMVTGFGSIQTAVEAMRHGAYDYLTKPCNNDELLIKVHRALDEQKKTKEILRLREMLFSESNFSNIISRSDKMKMVFTLIKQVAETDVTVLVIGETGTGKELVAQAIHFNSLRRDKPFIVIHCSAIPEALLESELFGHEKGAFTGANRQRIGKFEEARGGTIFLDEIGDVPFSLQTKLLRILQQKEFTRLGSNTAISVDVRIIAATNRDLLAMSGEGKFREDLYYRLNVFPIMLPSLKERIEDVPLLAEHFLHKYQSLARQHIQGFAPAVIHDMMNYDWRGNIREMENLIKRAIIKTSDDSITSIELSNAASHHHVPETIELAETTSTPYKQYLDNVIRDAEKKYLLRILKECRGNLNQVARMMDLDRKTVYRKVDEYKLDVDQFKA